MTGETAQRAGFLRAKPTSGLLQPTTTIAQGYFRTAGGSRCLLMRNSG